MNSLDILSLVSSDDALQMLRSWLGTEQQRLADLPTTTLFRNLTFALFPAVLTLFSGGDVVFFAVAFHLFVAAVVLAFVFPVRQDEPLENSAKAFFGFFGGIGLLVMLGFVLVVGVVAVNAVTSGPL